MGKIRKFQLFDLDKKQRLGVVLHYNSPGKKSRRLKESVPQFVLSYVYTNDSTNIKDWENEGNHSLRVPAKESSKTAILNWLKSIGFSSFTDDIFDVLMAMKE